VEFEWDPNKAANNFSKHGVRFAEVATVFEDEAALTIADDDHDEERFFCGIDNAHKARRRREFDHRHPYGSTKLIAYEYRGPAVLLEDFLREVERILTERGVL
jgi:hypothetical protein